MGNLNDTGPAFRECQYCRFDRELIRLDGHSAPPKAGKWVTCESCAGGHSACHSCRVQFTKVQGDFPDWFEVLTVCPGEPLTSAF